MKKLLSLSSAKILMICAAGLITTLGAFWHHQVNQAHLNRMSVLNQGVSTCFNRVSQTFTAMMIKDIKSPYLDRGFMGLSDECLNETIKGINPFKKNVGKGYETLNKLVGEVHWFHEKILKTHAPMLAGKGTEAPLSPLVDRFSKMENFKVSLVDEIDSANAQYREIQANDEVILGAGLLLFVIGLSVLSLQEFNRLQLRREIENQGLNLLKTGQANVGAMVDQIVDRALITQGMPVTAQVFKDYHGELLERVSSKIAKPSNKEVERNEVPEKTEVSEIPRASFKRVLTALQNIHPALKVSEVRDVEIAAEQESCEQIMNASVNLLNEKRTEKNKILVTNQVHSDKTIISFFLAGNTFNASELEYATSNSAVSAETLDMNMMILKEMALETGTNMHFENKADRNGNITGMNIRLVMKRVPKNKSKNLVSVVRGKKKDLAREMMN